MDGRIIAAKVNEQLLKGTSKTNTTSIWPTFQGNRLRTGNQATPQTGVNNYSNKLPSRYVLSSNFPNPFNLTTTIRYNIPKLSFVKIDIYDINGRLVETLVNENKNAGFYSVNWNAKNVVSGLYFYRIDAGDFIDVKKCLVVK